MFLLQSLERRRKIRNFNPKRAQGEGWEGMRVAEQRGETDPTWNFFAALKTAVIAANNTQGSVKMGLKISPTGSLGLASLWIGAGTHWLQQERHPRALTEGFPPGRRAFTQC